MLVKDVINRVTLLYNDADFVRCSKRQYLYFLDDAISQVILSRPDANVKTSTVTLKQGTRQTIPADGYSLIEIYANVLDVSEEKVTFGRPIYQIARKDIDYFRDWHNDDSIPGEIIEFSYDRRSPKTYWVWPPVGRSQVRVQMDYSFGVAPFGDIDQEEDAIFSLEIPLDEMYRTPIVNYILYLLYSTDSSSQLDRQLAQKYEQSFYQSLGIEYSASLKAMPRIFEQELQGMGVPENDPRVQ